MESTDKRPYLKNGGGRIDATAAQLRDMIANLDHAQFMYAERRELYDAQRTEHFKNEMMKWQEKRDREEAEIERQKQFLKKHKRELESENYGQTHFLRKEIEELKENNNEKVRKISELSTVVRAQKEEIQCLKAERDKFQKRCGELSKQSAGLSSEMAKLRTKLSVANTELTVKPRAAQPVPAKPVRRALPQPSVQLPRKPSVFVQSKIPASFSTAPVRESRPSTVPSFNRCSTNVTLPSIPCTEIVDTLLCGCSTVIDAYGVLRKWHHQNDRIWIEWESCDSGPLVLLHTRGDNISGHKGVRNGQLTLITLDHMGTLYLRLPDSSGALINRDNTYETGRYYSGNQGEEGRFEPCEVEGLVLERYPKTLDTDDDAIGYTSKELAFRHDNDGSTKIMPKGVSMQFVFIPDENRVILKHRLGDSETTCFEHTFR